MPTSSLKIEGKRWILINRGKTRLDHVDAKLELENAAREPIFVRRDLDTASALCHISAPRDSGFSIQPVILEESADNVAAALFLDTGPS